MAGALHPQLDRGYARSEAVRHRAQGCPTLYGRHYGLSRPGQSGFCATLTSLPEPFPGRIPCFKPPGEWSAGYDTSAFGRYWHLSHKDLT
jgi:hypothetical protein